MLHRRARTGGRLPLLGPAPLARPSGGYARSDRGLSSYMWMFARQAQPADIPVNAAGSTVIANGQYGGSQMGAILSYTIKPPTAPAMTAYARVIHRAGPMGAGRGRARGEGPSDPRPVPRDSCRTENRCAVRRRSRHRPVYVGGNRTGSYHEEFSRSKPMPRRDMSPANMTAIFSTDRHHCNMRSPDRRTCPFRLVPGSGPAVSAISLDSTSVRARRSISR